MLQDAFPQDITKYSVRKTSLLRIDGASDLIHITNTIMDPDGTLHPFRPIVLYSCAQLCPAEILRGIIGPKGVVEELSEVDAEACFRLRPLLVTRHLRNLKAISNSILCKSTHKPTSTVCTSARLAAISKHRDNLNELSLFDPIGHKVIPKSDEICAACKKNFRTVQDKAHQEILNDLAVMTTGRIVSTV